MKGPYPGWDKDLHFVRSDDLWDSDHAATSLRSLARGYAACHPRSAALNWHSIVCCELQQMATAGLAHSISIKNLWDYIPT